MLFKYAYDNQICNSVLVFKLRVQNYIQGSQLGYIFDLGSLEQTQDE